MSKRALARLGLIRNVRSQSSDAAPPVVTAIAGKPSAKAMEQQYESTDDDYAWDLENLPEFDGHDFTSRAHDQLTAQRIFREYYRKMAYELPQLSKFARPFTPPTVKQPLQFRYQTYCGESHPVEKKVAVLVNVDALGLSEKEVRKLVLLSGPRFDAHSRRLKMSHEGFPNANQNKKYLCDQLDKLIAEAKVLPRDILQGTKSLRTLVIHSKTSRLIQGM